MQSNQQNGGPVSAMFFSPQTFLASEVPKKKEAERMKFETLPNSTTFEIWKLNFKSEVRSSSSFPMDAMLWINEVDSAKSMNELTSSSSILGRMFSRFEVHYSPLASPLKKLLNSDLKRGVYMEEQKTQQTNDSWKEDISGTGEALLDFNDLLRLPLKGDNVQGLATKWNEVLLSMTTVPDDDMLEMCKNSSSISRMLFRGHFLSRHSTDKIATTIVKI